MPGKRATEGATYITPRTLYRDCIDGVDTNGPADDTIKSFNTAPGPNVFTDFNQYGSNGQINISAIIDGFSSVTLELWLNAVEETTQLFPDVEGSSSYSSLCLSSTNDSWALVGTKTITKSGFWITTNLPPGEYRVLVSAVSSTGTVTLLEQHSA